ncbi:AAA domain-containing protein [Candidatus Gracilibacteria bacterium]|nr:AAA domain-containing protein [Candidatus Gracilibacteria bacterium]
MKSDYISKIEELKQEIKKVVIGQDELIRDLLITLFCRGHILIEGVPGLAKTLTVSSLSKALDLDFSRVQFTPDLLPSDLIGARIYTPETKEFYIKTGPIVSNFVLADEINRAPSKVQSALLEAMAERQVTIADKTIMLDEPFIVLATQNPIEQDGTYTLPEAQLDRFLFKTVVSYPSDLEEIEIMKNNSLNTDLSQIKKVLGKKDILKIQSLISEVFVDQNIYEYIKDIVVYTRDPNNEIGKYLFYGASPRASIALLSASKALAFLSDRDFVIPEDIKEIAKQVLRHRLILNYEAIAENIGVDILIERVLNNVKVK